jgi:hypothetical protein
MRKKLNGQRNQCPTCGEYFTRNSVFDKHRTGNFVPPQRRCLSPAEMVSKGMFLGNDGFWRGQVAPENAVSYSTMCA